VEDPGADALREVLREAQRFGFLGPGSVDSHLTHSLGFAAVLDGDPPANLLDLGSGGGVPGLVLARLWPAARVTLLDASGRRVAFLESACERLDLAPRARALQARAEQAARRGDLRSAFDLVTARSFGPPAVTAECASGFLAPGGRLAVSEPPDTAEAGPVRWPAAGLAELGFTPAQIRRGDGVSVAVMTRTAELDDRWPRRTGIPAKRPRWR
jgi:SAM-dependent methyltransferase